MRVIFPMMKAAQHQAPGRGVAFLWRLPARLTPPLLMQVCPFRFAVADVTHDADTMQFIEFRSKIDGQPMFSIRPFIRHKLTFTNAAIPIPLNTPGAHRLHDGGCRAIFPGLHLPARFPGNIP